MTEGNDVHDETWALKANRRKKTLKFSVENYAFPKQNNFLVLGL